MVWTDLTTAPFPATIPTTMSLASKASEKIAQRLTWCISYRDQAGIAGELAGGKDISEVYGLGEAGLFDEFFYFLDELHIMDLFKGLEPGTGRRTSNVSFAAVILIYLMRIVAGLCFFWHIHPVILRSQALMRLVGFNGTQVRNGTSQRGRKKESSSSCEEDDIRGPLCPDSIAKYIQAISADALERFFNGVIRILAAKGFFPRHIHAVLDSSEIESTELCEGCGKVAKEKPPLLRLRKGRIKKVVEKVFGFKIWAVWDPASGFPLAVHFDTIEKNDTLYAREVIEKAVKNISPHAQMASIAFDRGFTDGSLLWWIADTLKIPFYIPAKKNMSVYADALCLVPQGISQSREKKRTTGRGKNKQIHTDYWRVVGIEALTSAGFYGEMGSGSHENRADFHSNPINAVVVLDDPYKVNNPGSDAMVILTNASVEKPLSAYDRYDARSTIENGLFREAKQGWFIERAAKNSASAFRSHVYLTLITMALTTAFRTWMDIQDKREDDGEETGIRRFRQKVKQENGSKLIIFDQGRYAIFDAYEVFILCGRNVLMPTGVVEKITKRDILLKYGALLE